jgi:hypothetical protein
LKKFFISIISFSLGFFSCKKEDTVVPIRDVAEQAIEDNQNIEDFLAAHFYNYDDFLDLDSNPELTFDSLIGENASKTPLKDQVLKKVIRVKKSDSTFVNHTLYYLIAREGEGIHPASVDSTYLAYEGRLLDGTVFDFSRTPVWFDLTQVVRGFREGMPGLKGGTFEVAEDNTVTFRNYGQGAIFIPSGLGYFNTSTGSIPSYSPLIFKINLYLVKQTDHDGDGILTADEFDQDGDGIADDTDGDGIYDYLDKN